MQLTLIVGSLIFGAILGSFINALSFRWGTGVSIFTGRSRCMRCGTTLRAIDLVPILSWLLLQGRCRYCGAKISAQYPLVEAAAALLSLGVFLIHPEPTLYAFWMLVWMILLFIVVYDARHKIIPWSCSIALAVLALVGLYLGFIPWGWGALFAGPILALPLVLLSLVSKGAWMGWGDGLLELSLGWFLGITAGFTAFLLAFWIGAFVGIGAIVFRRGLTIKSEVPFAPFLILGAGIAYFFHVDFFPTLPLLFG